MVEVKDFALLFDLDGVIFASENYYTDFWTMEAKKYLPNERDFAQKIKGHGLNDIFAKYFFDQPQIQQEIIMDLKQVESNMNFNYIDGVEEFLTSIQKENYTRCLVTSSMDDKMENVYKKRPQMQEFFPLVVTANQIRHSKPAPDCYLRASKLCNIAPSRCIVFEDSLAGLESAKTAGMKRVALSTTYSIEELKDKADMIIADFSSINISEILRLLE